MTLPTDSTSWWVFARVADPGSATNYFKAELAPSSKSKIFFLILFWIHYSRKDGFFSQLKFFVSVLRIATSGPGKFLKGRIHEILIRQ
jgi:hypothetical protein